MTETTDPNFTTMTMFTAAELLATCKKIHGTARSKGWWVVDDSGRCIITEDDTDEKLFLVVTELAEAFEEYRRSKTNEDLKFIYFAVPSTVKPGEVEKIVAGNDEALTKLSARHKPEGFPVEIGDAYIRILDLVGALAPELDLSTVIFYMTAADHYVSTEYEKTGHMGRIMYEITTAVTCTNEGDVPSVLKAIFLGMALIEGACNDLGVPLREAIAAKMLYNDTRPVRHGGKRA